MKPETMRDIVNHPDRLWFRVAASHHFYEGPVRDTPLDAIKAWFEVTQGYNRKLIPHELIVATTRRACRMATFEYPEGRIASGKWWRLRHGTEGEIENGTKL